MPHCLSVGTSKYHENLSSFIAGEIETLKNKGFGFEMAQKQQGKYLFWDINFLEVTDDVYFHQQFANALAKGVIKYWEEDFLKNILRQNYYYFTQNERQQILEIAREILRHINHEQLIFEELLDYMKKNTMINIEGFLRFRVQEYWHDLEETVDDAVDDYMLEKEYNEFIKLLQYFVEVQEPKLEKVHVVVEANGDFKLYDSKERLIDNEVFEGLIVEIIDTDLSYEDLLVSSLINISPLEIVVHIKSPQKQFNTVSTLKKIFSERVTTCNGCSWCRESPAKK